MNIFRRIFVCRKGFTLIEVFLTTALIGMIMTTIFATYSSGFKIWKAANAISSTTKRKFSLSLEKVKREIPGFIRDFDGIVFEGSKDELIFPYVEDDEIVEVVYFYDKGDDTLWRKTVKYTESLKEKMNKNVKKIFEADRVEFSYLVYDSSAEEANWEESFSEEDKIIPDAIRMDITQKGEKITEYVFMPK